MSVSRFSRELRSADEKRAHASISTAQAPRVSDLSIAHSTWASLVAIILEATIVS